MQNERRQNAVYSLLEANKEPELVLRDVYFVDTDDQPALITLLEKIRKNSSVKSLIIDSIGLSKNTIELIVGSFKQRLNSIKISEQEFKGPAAEYIILRKSAELSNLVFLDLSGCKIGAQGCSALNSLFQESENLTQLRLDNCALDDSQLSKLFGAVKPPLKVLSLKRNLIGPQGAEMIKIPSLEELSIGSNLLGIEGVKTLLLFFTTTSLLTLDVKLNFINNTSIKIAYSAEFEDLVMNFIKANKSRHITFFDLTEGVNHEISNLQTRIAHQKGILEATVNLMGSVNIMQDYDGNQQR